MHHRRRLMRYFEQKTGSEEHISPENPPIKIPEDPIFHREFRGSKPESRNPENKKAPAETYAPQCCNMKYYITAKGLAIGRVESIMRFFSQ